ncbi:MAG: STAS domain-containing protein [Pyrinomonadaceae bacterium]
MSKFKITEHRAGHVVVLDLEGPLTFGEGSVALREAIQSLLHEGKLNLLLNLGHVTYVDSAGLGTLVGAHTTVANAEGQLKLLHVTTNVKDLMSLTKIICVFDFYEDELEALNAFSLGEEYELVPYEGEVSWADAEEDERMLRWAKWEVKSGEGGGSS